MYLPVLEPPMPQEYSVVMVFLKLVALDGGPRCPGGLGSLNANVADKEGQEQDE